MTVTKTINGFLDCAVTCYHHKEGCAGLIYNNEMVFFSKIFWSFHVSLLLLLSTGYIIYVIYIYNSTQMQLIMALYRWVFS